MSAVPSEEPNCCAVFCSPPASLRASSPTLDCTTLPSCEASSPIPKPSSAIASANWRSSICGRMVASSQQIAASMTTSPQRTSSRGEATRASDEPPSAATSMVIETGRSRSPVSNALNPCTTCRYSGITKNNPSRIKLCVSSMTSPARSGAIRSSDSRTSGISPCFSRRRSQLVNRARSTPPAAMTNRVGENPKMVNGELRGCSSPQLLLCRTPSTTRASPAADRPLPRRPAGSGVRPPLGRRSSAATTGAPRPPPLRRRTPGAR